MAVTSIITNNGAMIALQSLEMTQQQLAVTQKAISTGYRVADSTDDGAAYAIAQSVRSSVGALTSANQQLGNVKGLLSTTQTALNSASNTMNSMRDILVKLGDQNVQGVDRTNYISQYQSLVQQLQTAIQDATYNGKSLLYSSAGAGVNKQNISVVRNEMGSTHTISSWNAMSLVYNHVNYGTAATGSLYTASHALAVITPGSAGATSDSFLVAQKQIGTWLNKIGNEINYVDNQVTYNNDKIDSLNSGLGALVDADMAKESAQLTALQIRQQLGTQALSLANQAPQTLLSLFK
ncbi:MAG TPA: flagellin [Rhodopila sp.]|nr:flagellin [Rhodopila sp.]